MFIGSFNFDPRSANLNTEMGFVIHSPALAKQMAQAFENQIADSAYQVVLQEDGSSLAWQARENGKTVMHTDEPGVSFWKRTAIRLLALLPIEWLL